MVEDKQILIDAEEFLQDEVIIEGNESNASSNPYCDTTASVLSRTEHHSKRQKSHRLISIETITGRQGHNGSGTFPGKTIRGQWTFLFPKCTFCRNIREIFTFHWRLLLSASLTVISASGCLIFFPMHLENVTEGRESDGYSACFTVTTINTALFLLSSCFLKALYWKSGTTILKPLISWGSIVKIGFSTGLSLLTIFSSWEDHKVICNFQDPLLGLMFIFASITHAVSKWKGKLNNSGIQ